ncbi:nucleopolyhedrovirus P10 family protein [Streptomyces sp. H39-S7]|uniref:nucleopolyhedrovirus P10 family protein n=1 Tax=Streptomyces sp. H39-S7 TaxID=3004357 RepID=UPI0022AF4E97|nr:nucleopolyhedrovirus P10 family protein [Streptomyces sp. H39-S7]MCZ4121105.1 nucleopolyhedrovirus P10 family protein [Streptomyces sp. H39-S7]
MTVDRLTRAVREQIAFGRVLPLGGVGDGAWITESAAADALRGAVAGLPGVRVGALRISPEAGGPDHPEPAAEAERAAGGAGASLVPPSAVPYGPLCLSASFEAATDRPLPATAERLRAALWRAAHDQLGLPLTTVDHDVTGLMDTPAGPGALPAFDAVPQPAVEGPAGASGQDPVEAGPAPAANGVVVAALLVPGVARVTSRLGGFASGIRTADGGDPPAREVRVQIAVVPGHRALDVARAVGAAVTEAAQPGAPGPVTTAVVVTASG